MQEQPSIRSLAKIAGVSSATVSMALRNHPKISPPVRHRIQQLAAREGYTQNPVVANLLTQLRLNKTIPHQSTLGMLFLGGSAELLKSSPTFRDWIAGSQTRAKTLGYSLDQFLLNDTISPSRLAKILEARRIKGLIVFGIFEGNAIPREFDLLWTNYAATVIGTHSVRPALSWVSNDQFSTAAYALEETYKLGYRRPALCLNADIDARVDNRFAGGFHIAHSKLNLTSRIPVFSLDGEAKGRFGKWLKKHRPDVILTIHPEIKEWAESFGIRAPRDIGLVNLDNTADSSWAGMIQNNQNIGSAAVDAVVAQINRNEIGIPPFQKCILISSAWIPGKTVQKQRAAAKTATA
ncbi:MAG: LacI family DNA-binding transcriptional regulator [Verrucomicrobiota bacterium]